MPSANSHTAEVDVCIVGAGMSGITMLHHLHKLGFSVRIIERAPKIGGTWYWNCYPGARVDTDVPLYDLSIEELWKTWNWSEAYPGRDELVQYFKHVDKTLKTSEHCSFNTSVLRAEFEQTTDTWLIHTDTGLGVRARFFLPCTGFAAKRYVPGLDGLENFEGECYHTSMWPQTKVELEGKRIAVIGTGASGVQCIQTCGPIAKHLTVFQRTPNLALPMVQRSLEKEEQETNKAQGKYEEAFKHRRETFGGFRFDFKKQATFDATEEERNALWEQSWAEGGFTFWMAGYNDVLIDQKANDAAYAFWAKKTRARISNVGVADELAPLTPPHAFGTKRPSLERTYFETFNLPHVDLVNVSKTPISKVTSTGLELENGQTFDFDVLILATGFDSITGSLIQMDISGINGQSLKEKWSTGCLTQMGMISSGFPNMFFCYGPQGPVAFANGPTCIEIQSDWIVACLAHMKSNALTRIDTTRAEEVEWKVHINDIINATLFPGTKSWYMGANIPGKVREVLGYCGGISTYDKLLRQNVAAGFPGFQTSALGALPPKKGETGAHASVKELTTAL